MTVDGELSRHVSRPKRVRGPPKPLDVFVLASGRWPAESAATRKQLRKKTVEPENDIIVGVDAAPIPPDVIGICLHDEQCGDDLLWHRCDQLAFYASASDNTTQQVVGERVTHGLIQKAFTSSLPLYSRDHRLSNSLHLISIKLAVISTVLAFSHNVSTDSTVLLDAGLQLLSNTLTSFCSLLSGFE